MKKIKYTPDAADKLRALKSAISGEYGGDKAKKIIKSITDAIRGLYDYEMHGTPVNYGILCLRIKQLVNRPLNINYIISYTITCA